MNDPNKDLEELKNRIAALELELFAKKN